MLVEKIRSFHLGKVCILLCSLRPIGLRKLFAQRFNNQTNSVAAGTPYVHAVWSDRVIGDQSFPVSGATSSGIGSQTAFSVVRVYDVQTNVFPSVPVVALLGQTSFLAGRRNALASALQNLDLPQLRDELLDSQSHLRHRPSSFLVIFTLFT